MRSKGFVKAEKGVPLAVEGEVLLFIKNVVGARGKPVLKFGLQPVPQGRGFIFEASIVGQGHQLRDLPVVLPCEVGIPGRVPGPGALVDKRAQQRGENLGVQRMR